MEDQAKEKQEVRDIRQRPSPRRTRSRGQRGSIMRRRGAAFYTIVYRAPGGKQKREGGFRTKENAQQRLDVMLGSIRSNTYVEPKAIRFENFCSDWMGNAKAILKPKTWASYQSALKNWITPKFGDWEIADINRASVKGLSRTSCWPTGS